MLKAQMALGPKSAMARAGEVEAYFFTLTQSMFTLFYTGCFFDNISLLAEMMFAETWRFEVADGIVGTGSVPLSPDMARVMHDSLRV